MRPISSWSLPEEEQATTRKGRIFYTGSSVKLKEIRISTSSISPREATWRSNALQRASTVVLQNSSREGFGLTVTEALWKAKPVIASAVGGIPLQVIHERSGLLTKSQDETEYYLKKVLSDSRYAMRLGENGREHVRCNFLITRHIRDCLRLFGELSNGKTAMKGQ